MLYVKLIHYLVIVIVNVVVIVYSHKPSIFLNIIKRTPVVRSTACWVFLRRKSAPFFLIINVWNYYLFPICLQKFQIEWQHIARTTRRITLQYQDSIREGAIEVGAKVVATKHAGPVPTSRTTIKIQESRNTSRTKYLSYLII